MDINIPDKKALKNIAAIGLTSENQPVVARPVDKSPYRGYKPVAPLKTDLRKLSAGSQLEVWGRVLNLSDSKPLPVVGIELWHLSPISDQKKHRAKLITDGSGSYRFITDLPGREKGKDYIVYFKISHMGQSYFTKLSFNNARARLSARAIQKHWHGSDHSELHSHGRDPNRTIFQFDICLGAY
ncbi:MAG: hypothetical protein ACR2MM_05085 [Flavobacteriaceae bacterium]